MNHAKRIVVVGATSAIAEHCCRLWVEREPVDLVLVARNRLHAERIAVDLRVRARQGTVRVKTVDFLSTSEVAALADRLSAEAPLDIVLIAQGMLPPQDLCQEDLAKARETIDVNAVASALFAEAFAKGMAQVGRGTLGLLGSVAGDRPRRANYTYGASKAFMEAYATGLRHRFAGTAIKVVLIKPGPTDTPMAAAHKAVGRRLASVEEVARGTVRALDLGKAVVYLPWKWWPIMTVFKLLPRFVFNRLDV